jgi:Trk K+ transport system NAD-binding subunit
VEGDATDASVLRRADPADAVGVVAGTDNDTTNLSLADAARDLHPGISLIGRRNLPANALLYAAMQLDAVLVPTELVAHEAYAHLSTPLLWRFLQEMPAQGDVWASRLLVTMADRCGQHLAALWKVRLTAREAPALQRWLAEGAVTVGDLLRSPDDREQELDALVLLLLRGDDSILTPDAGTVLEPDDQLLVAGRSTSRRALDTTLVVEPVCDYVITGRAAAGRGRVAGPQRSGTGAAVATGWAPLSAGRRCRGRAPRRPPLSPDVRSVQRAVPGRPGQCSRADGRSPCGTRLSPRPRPPVPARPNAAARAARRTAPAVAGALPSTTKASSTPQTGRWPMSSVRPNSASEAVKGTRRPGRRPAVRRRTGRAGRTAARRSPARRLLGLPPTGASRKTAVPTSTAHSSRLRGPCSTTSTGPAATTPARPGARPSRARAGRRPPPAAAPRRRPHRPAPARLGCRSRRP